MLIAGAWRVGGILRHAAERFPIATVAAVVLFSAYAVPFLLLLRMIEFVERQPRSLYLAALAWGGLVATSAAISGSAAAQNIMAKKGSPDLAAHWGPAVAGTGVEETLKVLGVATIALLARSRIRTTVDGFVYGALVGLGFQVVENMFFAINAVAVESGTDDLSPVVVTLLLRGFFGGLWSHTLFTAVAGAGFAYALVRTDRSPVSRGGVALLLFGVACGFHFLWNSPVFDGGFGRGVFGAVAVLLVKGIPALLVGVALIVAAERREADYYAAMLAYLADSRVATPTEIAALVSPRRRLAVRRHAKLRLGRAGARAVRRLQRSQAQLAMALARERDAEVMRWRCDVLVRRHQLLALSLDAKGIGLRRTPALGGAVVIFIGGFVISLAVLAVAIAILALGGA